MSPMPSPDEERPLGELLSDLTSQVQALVRKEMELAKAEVKEEVSKAVKGIAAFAVAGVVAFIGAIVLVFAAAWGLAELIATGLAFLVVAVLLLAVAAVAGLKGKAKLAEVSPMPEQTVETVKQDVQTAKESLQQGASGPTYPDPWRKN